MIKIAPSVLAADYMHFKEEIKKVESGGADLLHIDIMDGNFVPNISFGPALVKSIRKVTRLPLDVHLMILNPEKYVKIFKDAGANIITIHVEVCKNLNKTIKLIKSLGVKAGVSLNPATHINRINNILGKVDLVLVMSVNPGFGGQKFINSVLGKIRTLKKKILKEKFKALIEVDGGVSEENSRDVIKAGADILVAGVAIFKQKNARGIIQKLRGGGKYVKFN